VNCRKHRSMMTTAFTSGIQYALGYSPSRQKPSEFVTENKKGLAHSCRKSLSS
jgi:hypothetical protein